MRCAQAALPRIVSQSSVLALLACIAACSKLQSFDWTEEMRLSDGRVINAQRREEYRRVSDPGAGFRGGWLFQRAAVTAELPAPASRKVSWEGTLQPIALDVIADGTVYLVCAVVTGSGEIEWKTQPDERYVPFKLGEHGWQRVRLDDVPRSVQANLLGSTETLFIDQGARSGIHIDLKAKAKIDAESRIDKSLKTIIRPPLSGKKQ